MPFLRFSRDKRGYETTALVHAVRRDGRSRQRILYWFRSPPGVRVGRPALDEDAIRRIEEQNPDVEFDWPKILEAKAPAAPPADDPRTRRRRDRPDPASARRRTARPEVASARQAVEPAKAPPEPLEPAFALGAPAGKPGDLDETDELEPSEPMEPVEPKEPLEPVFVDPASAGQAPAEPAEPAVHSVGPELLTRLRARYAELLARITERAGSPERMEALRAQALPLDPDGWVTDAEVRTGIDAFEPRMRDLRSALGLRRRRRSHRGGRRRKPEGGGQSPPANH